MTEKPNESVYYTEIKENEDNFEEVARAKAEEIQNFQSYNAFEETEDEGQKVLGTRFMRTEKSEGSIKARFVVKGFMEDEYQADSPTTSRDTFKVFCSVCANEKWTLEASDVRAAFLQSDSLDRKVFIEPPKELKKQKSKKKGEKS